MVDVKGAVIENPVSPTRLPMPETPEAPRLPPRTLLLSPEGRQTAFSYQLAEYGLAKNADITTHKSGGELFENGNIVQAQLADANTILGEAKILPNMIIVDLPTPSVLEVNDEHIVNLVYNYWSLFNKQNRPVVIMNCPGYEVPLFVQSRCQGFLFASSPDELIRNVDMGKTLLDARTKPEIFTPEGLSSHQEQQYDASDDLREWEQKTADTYQSLRLLLGRIAQRNSASLQHRQNMQAQFSDLLGTPKHEVRPVDTEILPLKPIKTILEAGPGEGRIGGMLARLGFHVLAVDISNKMLARAEARIGEEGKGLRGELSDPRLSYNALHELEKEGLLPQPPILNDAETKRNYILTQGNFFRLYPEINQLLREWQQRYPDIDRASFMDAQQPSAFSDKYDMLADAGFDMALFNWHTLNEVGDLENQKRVLEQVKRALLPGGEVIIEIPNRYTPPYSDALRAYHATHPDEPFGMLRESFQDEAGQTPEYSPRYFPSTQELTSLLTALGFEVNPERDIQSYTISGGDNDATAFQEHFITARKPKY